MASSQDDQFMEETIEVAKLSEDPRTKEGACVVNSEIQILGKGKDDELSSKFPVLQKMVSSQDKQFLEVAIEMAKLSKDPRAKVGACIVNSENQIIGKGYNCMPKGKDDEFSWFAEGKTSPVCHAELNAIRNARNVENCRIYVTLMPCNECAKLIVQFGITEVIYIDSSDQPTFIKAKSLLAKCGVPVRPPKMASSQDDQFMEEAIKVSKLSKDPRTKVGACVVNSENQILGKGYNCMPKGKDDEFSWSADLKNDYVCHAELNAIRNSQNIENCRIYVTLMPCNECAKLIIQFGITEVIYMESRGKRKYRAAQFLLQNCGVEVRQWYSEN